jgi:hypothetical protein
MAPAQFGLRHPHGTEGNKEKRSAARENEDHFLFVANSASTLVHRSAGSKHIFSKISERDLCGS